LEDSVVDGRIILRWIFSKYNGGMDWMHLALDRGMWQILANVIMNLQVS
jgi:hypothetical protein